MPYEDAEDKRTGGRLIALSLLLLLGINGFFGATLWQDWQDTLAQARQHAKSLTESVAAHVDATVSGTDRLLAALTEILHERMGHHNGGKLIADDPEVTALLHRLAPLHPELRAVTVIAPDGSVLNDSRDPGAPRHRLLDRAYFTYHRDGGEDRLFIDRPAVSRIDQRWFIGMSRRLADLDGHFAGVLDAVVDPEYLRRFFASLGVSEGGFIELFDRSGVVLAREPGFTAAIGRPLAAPAPGADRLAANAAGDFEDSAADGRRLIASYRALDGYPLVVMSALARDQVLASWHRELLYQALAAALANLAVIGFTWVLRRQVRRLHAAARDLTASEEQAVDARRRLTDAIENMSEGFALYDSDERLVLCNSHYRKMAGPAASLVQPGMPYEALLRMVAAESFVRAAAADPERWIETRLYLHRRPPPVPVEQETADGEWVLARSFATGDGGRAHIRTDVTYLKQQQLELTRQELKLRTTVEHIVQGLCLFDAEGRLALWNRNWLTLLDLPASFARVGTPLEEVVLWRAARGDYGPGDPAAILERRRAALLGVDDHVDERTLPSGRVLEVQGVPMPGGGRLTTYTDITTRKRHEDELKAAKITAERASEVKSLFLAKMSHELRTPFNAIIGFADMITTRAHGDDRDAMDAYAGYALEIRDSGQHLLDLLNNILDISKIESGRMEVRVDRFDIRQTLVSALNLVRAAAHSQGVALTLDIAQPLSDTRADERAVKQIVTNLLSNALKFTPEGGHIILGATATADGGFEISVGDTGVGIAPDEIERVQQPFEQGDNRYSRAMGGTGVGLALVNGLVDLHGGILRIESQPGHGTTVTVTFPRHGPEESLGRLPAAGRA